MVYVKICGITNVRDARLAARLGADALGFNFFKASTRYIRPERARAIIAALPPFVTSVGVFVDHAAEDVNEICRMCNLDVAQLHGEESPRVVDAVRGVRRIKAIRVRDEADVARCRRYHVDAFLLDTWTPGMPGGTGQAFRWPLARLAAEFGPVIVAGGLTPGNVEEAILAAHPYAVDVASGVESTPGKKDKALMQAFIRKAKGLEV